MFVLDDSNKVQQVWETQKTFFKELANKLDIGPDKTNVAAVKVNNHAETIFNFREHFNAADIGRAIDGTTFRKGDRIILQDWVCVILEVNVSINS